MATGKNPAKTAATGETAGFMKALKPSPALAVIVGSDPLPRTEATKRLWAYIKLHGLQDPASKQTIVPDETLKAVLGRDRLTMFEMTKLVSPHLS